jgi:hypothetical protein
VLPDNGTAGALDIPFSDDAQAVEGRGLDTSEYKDPQSAEVDWEALTLEKTRQTIRSSHCRTDIPQGTPSRFSRRVRV